MNKISTEQIQSQITFSETFSTDFFKSVHDELFNNILPYWEKHARDTRPGFQGFFGEIDNSNKPDPDISRSIVMTSRFLWTYSAVARYTKDPRYLEMSDFAYKAITAHFWDKKNGGVYWSVTPDGTPDVSKKQIYGEAFCIYGLSEYAAALKELRNGGGESLPLAAAGNPSSATPSPKGESLKNPAESLSLAEQSMKLATDLYSRLEAYAKDSVCGGYIEACAQDWSPTSDMILSPKDMNCPKSMNTNLHVMEAYTNLYRTILIVFPDQVDLQAQIGRSLKELVLVTTKHILQPNNHLGMFFDMKWKLLSDEVSYGHDIEASWLLWEAANELKDKTLIEGLRTTVIAMAETAYNEGIDFEAYCMEDFQRTENGKVVRNRNRVWWVQAEAVNGFYYAWKITSQEKYAKACVAHWNWILNHQKDKEGGDWWNELDEKGAPVLSEAKGGNWKTSYHNGRTCLELLRGNCI